MDEVLEDKSQLSNAGTRKKQIKQFTAHEIRKLEKPEWHRSVRGISDAKSEKIAELDESAGATLSRSLALLSLFRHPVESRTSFEPVNLVLIEGVIHFYIKHLPIGLVHLKNKNSKKGRKKMHTRENEGVHMRAISALPKLQSHAAALWTERIHEESMVHQE